MLGALVLGAETLRDFEGDRRYEATSDPGCSPIDSDTFGLKSENCTLGQAKV